MYIYQHFLHHMTTRTCVKNRFVKKITAEMYLFAYWNNNFTSNCVRKIFLSQRVFVLTIFFFLVKAKECSLKSQVKLSYINNTIILDCHITHKNGESWRKTGSERGLYAGTRRLHNQDNKDISANYSLIVTSISFKDEGEYICSQNSTSVVIQYCLKVKRE